MNDRIIWYFADPMCSWCWGFTPVVERLKNTFEHRIKIALVLGGLRPYTTEPITEQLRNEILHHWHDVQKMTGQEFCFDGAMENGFVYDTEPASRAVLTVGKLLPEATFAYFKKVQKAFYVDRQNVTRKSVLMKLLDGFSIDTVEFEKFFVSEEARKITQDNFYKSRQFGVHGFPTMVLQTERHYFLLTNGYRSFEDIQAEINECLREVECYESVTE